MVVNCITRYCSFDWKKVSGDCLCAVEIAELLNNLSLMSVELSEDKMKYALVKINVLLALNILVMR